ncbi:MAG TPA: peptide chain release factor N(5)-glutamine methyltransferase [Gemmatimonadales bacterium]|nr:peptide chain release factor N(5)-glutamine methyltransferase [Gemmatimonadales bacterium]
MESDARATIADLFDEATVALKAAGVIKPRREANRLWAWLTRTNPGEAYLGRERTASLEAIPAFRDAVARRAAGEPIAYVLGRAGFRHLELRADRRALIPRPETEGLVEIALGRVKSGRVLDLGTGTGCLALALAQEGSFARVIGADLSAAALSLASENARLTGLPVHFLRSDCGLGLAEGHFDLLVTNPPYLTDAEYDALHPSVKAWEPRMALASGVDGLEATRRILGQGLKLLAPGGWLVMELDSTRSAASAGLAQASGWTAINVWDDLYGRPRYLTARRDTQR